MKKQRLKSFGAAFGDKLELSGKRGKRADAEDLIRAENWEEKRAFWESGRKSSFRLSPWRLVPVYFIFGAAIIILLARAFDLQIIQGDFFLSKAQGNYIRVEVEHAPRGVVYDRNGKVLARNRPGFRLFIEPKNIPEEKRKIVYSKLSSILKISEENLKQELAGQKEDQITLENDLSSEKALLIETATEALPGVGLEINPIRYYPYKEIASHILGYPTEADEKDLSRKLDVPYSLGDKVGKAGVEQAFEDKLRGTNGYALVSISATGTKKGKIYQSSSKPGNNVTLSIDIDLQSFVYETLRKKMKETGSKGASAVILDPGTGEILALVSLPSYDNNIFSKGLTQAAYEKLISSPDKRLLNRSIGASYPPGSTFKMVTATAGLESGAIKPETKIEDPGFIKLGDQVFNNWLWLDSRRKEGSINVVRAIARSTDTFFYRLGQMIGEKTIEKYALGFGLGSKTGIELPSETAGLVPNEKWKLATKGESWYPGETLNISIGQGDLLLTPLQVSRVISVFANGGKLVVPTILKTNKPNVEKKSFLKMETLKSVSEGLYQNTVGDGNVGWLFSGFKIKTAGKTGTAESGREVPHAWYTGYAPYPKGEIVVTVQIEHAGHGSEEAAPVVKEIFKWWFEHRN